MESWHNTGEFVGDAMLLSDVCLTSDKQTFVCLSDRYIGYIGSKSRTERPRKTEIGTEVSHVTRDSDTTFKVKRSRSPGRFTHRHVKASGSCSGQRGNVLLCFGRLGGVRRFGAH